MHFREVEYRTGPFHGSRDVGGAEDGHDPLILLNPRHNQSQFLPRQSHKVDQMGPRDSLRDAMKLRLHRKAHEAQQQRDTEARQAEYKADREYATTSRQSCRDDTMNRINSATYKELSKMELSGTGLAKGITFVASTTNLDTAVRSPSEAYVSDVRNDYGVYTRLLHQTRIMCESNLETIETTLDLLNAMEGMSPHVKQLRKQMVDKQKWANAKRDSIWQLEKLEYERQEDHGDELMTAQYKESLGRLGRHHAL
ncbi:hypothetical protein K504DRAFT_499881 [Pleomassaria siparia CBS 279.74]|uniref:Uncharacterized protein n=1 Tax=Pleomassaria siparia CBS 279.74 TaxID=1314801 RepID=A0A6G1KKB8_9PLEO|nr:hypothetical protein K504DRAFT_499881 [Pleomassaria siparia CBS 279.74]